jgi:ORF6N domain
MLDADLATLYGVETRALAQAVKRNLARFPDDFMFQLSFDKATNLRSQSVISSWGGRRTPPYAFTEQGVAMLSSVLHSERAAQVNVEIMRTFVRLRELLSSHAGVRGRASWLDRDLRNLDLAGQLPAFGFLIFQAKLDDFADVGQGFIARVALAGGRGREQGAGAPG